MIQIYKPNSKNTGSAFTFTKSKNLQNGSPALYFSAIAQHGWNDETKTGSFAGNAKDPSKTINVKISELEAGDFISAFNNRYEHTAFHSYDGNNSTIKATPWDKPVKVSKYNPSSKKYEEGQINVPAFGITLSKGKGNTIKIALDPGEVENLKILLSSFISDSLEFKFNSNLSKSSSYNKQNKQEENIEEEELECAPF